MSKKFTLMVTLLLAVLSLNSFAQAEKKSSNSESRATLKQQAGAVKGVETAILVYHNNDPSDVNLRDFIWSLEGPSDFITKTVANKLKSNSYFSNVNITESGIENRTFIQFTLTSKYEETKVLSAFEAAGVLYKKLLDQDNVEKIKE